MAGEENGRGRLGEALAAARSKRGLITISLLLAMLVTALEQTVVSTAMPSIIAQLKGLDIYPWVFSAYLLAATVTTPIYGKLADIFGRKRVLLFGLGLFGLGSVLTGLSQTMPQLIAMRVIQGLGAGAVGPIVLTMLGDLFTLEERAKVQALFSAVWGGSSLAGPWVGGQLTDHISWRAVFFVTVPFSVVSAWILVTQVQESLKEREVRPIDWAGAGLLSLGSMALLLAVLGEGGRSLATGAGLLLGSFVLFGLFVWRERVAADPVLPLDLLASPHIAAAMTGSFLLGVLLFAIDTYVPLYVQGVNGGSASKAGEMITPLFLAWSISVFLAAKVVVRLGFRKMALAGAFLILAGVGMLALGAFVPGWSRGLFLPGLVIVGLGMAPSSLSYILGVQNAVPWERRGAATAAVMFFRTLGGALGVGVLGAYLARGLGQRLAGVAGVDVSAALRPETHKLLSPEQLAIVQRSLGVSLRDVFLVMAGLSVLLIVVSLVLRGGRATSHSDAGAEGVEEAEPVGMAVGVEH